jgi:hypothetical protein
VIEPALALAAAIFGGVGLKVVESVLNRSKVKNDMESQMRAELRGDVMNLKDEIIRVGAALDVWRKKYYSLLLSFNELVVAARSGESDAQIDLIVDKIRSEGGT